MPAVAHVTQPKLPVDLPAALRTLGRRVICPKDRWVFRKGSAVQAVFLVLDGEVCLSRFASDGGEITLQRARRGDFFAEAALHAPRYNCNARATQPSTVLAFPAETIRKLLEKDPGVRPPMGSAPRTAVARRAGAPRKAGTYYNVERGLVEQAEAALPGRIDLVTTPARFTVPPDAIFTMAQSGAGYRMLVANTSARAVIIFGRSFEGNDPVNPLLFYEPVDSQPQCVPGFRLAPGETCHLDVRMTLSW